MHWIKRCGFFCFKNTLVYEFTGFNSMISSRVQSPPFVPFSFCMKWIDSLSRASIIFYIWLSAIHKQFLHHLYNSITAGISSIFDFALKISYISNQTSGNQTSKTMLLFVFKEIVIPSNGTLQKLKKIFAAVFKTKGNDAHLCFF